MERISKSMLQWVVNRRVGELPTDIYVGRPTEWGNPFKVGSGSTGRGDAIRAFAEWLLDEPALIEKAKKELRGKRLVCWCAPERCHAEIWVLLANGHMSIEEIVSLHESTKSEV
tara:strand:+ start:1444 stop:1785 length:342 start_codon:yes stop_codon:yes gene_type:complete